MTSNQEDKLERGDEYHLEEEVVSAEEAVTNKRRVGLVAGLAALFFVAAVVLVVYVSRREKEPTSKYTVDSSKYGVPDDCDGITTLCEENLETGIVKCSCGNYLFQWDESSGGWVLSSGSGNN